MYFGAASDIIRDITCLQDIIELIVCWMDIQKYEIRKTSYFETKICWYILLKLNESSEYDFKN